MDDAGDGFCPAYTPADPVDVPDIVRSETSSVARPGPHFVQPFPAKATESVTSQALAVRCDRFAAPLVKAEESGPITGHGPLRFRPFRGRDWAGPLRTSRVFLLGLGLDWEFNRGPGSRLVLCGFIHPMWNRHQQERKLQKEAGPCNTGGSPPM
jgi:hypothetical protein